MFSMFNSPKDRRKQRRKEEKRQEKRRGVRAAKQKAVKPFDKTTYRHPTGKISATFIEYANHIIDMENLSNPPSEDENLLLQVCQTVWNTVVLDTTEGGTKHVHELLVEVPDKKLRAMIELLIQVKRSEFGNDQRLIDFFECVPEDDGFRLVVGGAHPPALEPLLED